MGLGGRKKIKDGGGLQLPGRSPPPGAGPSCIPGQRSPSLRRALMSSRAVPPGDPGALVTASGNELAACWQPGRPPLARREGTCRGSGERWPAGDPRSGGSCPLGPGPSHIVHSQGPPTCRKIVSRATAPGGPSHSCTGAASRFQRAPGWNLTANSTWSGRPGDSCCDLLSRRVHQGSQEAAHAAMLMDGL